MPIISFYSVPRRKFSFLPNRHLLKGSFFGSIEMKNKMVTSVFAVHRKLSNMTFFRSKWVPSYRPQSSDLRLDCKRHSIDSRINRSKEKNQENFSHETEVDLNLHSRTKEVKMYLKRTNFYYQSIKVFLIMVEVRE